MVMAASISRCSPSRVPGGTGSPRAGPGLSAGGTDRGQMSGVDPGIDQSDTSSSSGAPKTSRDHCSCVHAVDAVRAVGEAQARSANRAGA